MPLSRISLSCPFFPLSRRELFFSNQDSPRPLLTWRTDFNQNSKGAIGHPKLSWPQPAPWQLGVPTVLFCLCNTRHGVNNLFDTNFHIFQGGHCSHWPQTRGLLKDILGNILQIYWNTAVCFPVEFLSYWCNFQTRVFRVTYLWAMFLKPAKTNQTLNISEYRPQSSEEKIFNLTNATQEQSSGPLCHITF